VTPRRLQSPVSVARPDQPDDVVQVRLFPPVIPDFEEASEVVGATRHLAFPISWSATAEVLTVCRVTRSRSPRRDLRMTATAPTMLEFHSGVVHVIRVWSSEFQVRDIPVANLVYAAQDPLTPF